MLFAVALLVTYLFARTPQLMRLYGHDTDWLMIIAIILAFFGLGTLIHSLSHALRSQFRVRQSKGR